MRNLFFIILLLPIFGFSQFRGIKISSDMPMKDVKFEDSRGDKYDLNSLSKKNGLLVIFSSNTCPFVKAWETDYAELSKIASDNNIGMVLVNSNEKYRDGVDSKSEMLKTQIERKYSNIKYLIDSNSKLALAFEANTTPHVFLFDGNNKLVYKGSIDNRYEVRGKVANVFYLKNALVELGSGKSISIPDTKNFGCSIKKK